MFSASTTYEKQLRIKKTRLSHQVWSHGGSTFKKNMTLNGHFSRPAQTDPYGGHQGALCAEYLEEWDLTWSKGYLSEKYAAQNVKAYSA